MTDRVVIDLDWKLSDGLLLGMKPGLAGQLEVQVATSYPAAEVAQFCTGKRKAIPAKRQQRPEEFGVLSPLMLDMQLPDSDTLRVSPGNLAAGLHLVRLGGDNALG